MASQLPKKTRNSFSFCQEPSSTGNVISSLSDFSAIKELDKITKEIEDLGR